MDRSKNNVSVQDGIVTASTWSSLLSEGCDFDLWGQPVEATEIFLRLKRNIKTTIDQSKKRNYMEHHNGLVINEHQERILSKVMLCLDLRCQALRSQEPLDSGYESITLEEMRQTVPWVLHVFDDATDRPKKYSVSSNFPVELSPYQQQQQILHATSNQFDEDHSITNGASPNLNSMEEAARGRIGSLLPPPVMEKGKTYISLKLEKIGLKDALDYMDPYVTVSVKNLCGSDLTMPQSTPVAVRKEETFIFFDHMTVHLQKPLEYLPVGFAIFFEFKHYKPKKKKNSLKCFSFVEKDELRDGAKTVLELYKKPIDTKRKKLRLLTERDLYLHLDVHLRVD